MRTGLGLPAFARLLALTACGGSITSVPADIPANFNSISERTEIGGDHLTRAIGKCGEVLFCCGQG